MINKALWWTLLPLMLAGCDGATTDDTSGSGQRNSDAGAALDKKAIAAGILPDTENFVFGGRYETRSEMGTDKFCAVKSGSRQFAIGALAVFGPESKCEARGQAAISGEKVKISFSGKGSCSFEAGFDGIELRFPGALEPGCAAYCTSRASFSGTSYFIVETGDDNAKRALGRDFEKLCQ
jgi:hypothetical protein